MKNIQIFILFFFFFFVVKFSVYLSLFFSLVFKMCENTDQGLHCPQTEILETTECISGEKSTGNYIKYQLITKSRIRSGACER